MPPLAVGGDNLRRGPRRVVREENRFASKRIDWQTEDADRGGGDLGLDRFPCWVSLTKTP